MSTPTEPAQEAAAKPIQAPGRSLAPKVDAWPMVTGRTTYVGDIRLPGMLHMAVVRSPVAHADLRAIDLDHLRAQPDVLDAFGPAEVQAAADPVQAALTPESIGAARVDLPALEHRVRYVGQPVAVVVARTRRAARRAAADARITLHPLPPVNTAEQAVAAGAPVLHADRGLSDNVLLRPRFTVGDADDVLSSAPHRVQFSVRIPRTTVAPLEPRGIVADWQEDGGLGRLTLHATHQHPFQLRDLVAGPLRLTAQQVRVIVPTVGGSFGLKMTGAVEEVLVGLASMRLGAPVSWMESREECTVAGAREQVHNVCIGFDGEGRLLALRDDGLVPVGAGGALPGWRMAYVSAASLPGAYDVPNVTIDSRIVLTTQPPWVSARGWGKEVPVLILEHGMDVIAAYLGLDPAAVRTTNLLPTTALPHTMPSGYSIDSGDFAAVLGKVIAAGDLQARRSHADSVSDDRIVEGVGLAFELTPEGGGHPTGPVGPQSPPVPMAPESARVTLTADGAIVYSGVTSPGGGNETAIARLVADRLGVHRDRVRVVQGDTDECPPGTGNASSRGAAIGGAAALVATNAVIAQCTEALGKFSDLANVVQQLRAAGRDELLTATREYRPDAPEGDAAERRPGYPYFSNGAYLAHVRVDVATGRVALLALDAVHDCGTVLEPVLVDGQLHGAMAMGASMALQEQLVQDPEGRPLTQTFKEYLVPRANDLPTFTVGHHETPSPRTLLGAKGGGEAGLSGAQAAVVNAVYDAVRRHTGTRPRDLELPLTPPRVLSLLGGGES
jgi:carbon-monoxide dehydrogenase large subunit